MTGVLSREEVQHAIGAPDWVIERLAAHLDLLRRWNARINLVGGASLRDPWRRHVLDSAQLMTLMPVSPEALRIVDFGSGAGYPGLVLAILRAGEVHLYESDQRKAAFLREAARATDTELTIHPVRIENSDPIAADIVTARAFAPLTRLLNHAAPFLQAARSAGNPDPRALILKGKRYEEELTEARKRWNMRIERFPSITDPAGVALRIELLSLGDNES